MLLFSNVTFYTICFYSPETAVVIKLYIAYVSLRCFKKKKKKVALQKVSTLSLSSEENNAPKMHFKGFKGRLDVRMSTASHRVSSWSCLALVQALQPANWTALLQVGSPDCCWTDPSR